MFKTVTELFHSAYMLMDTMLKDRIHDPLYRVAIILFLLLLFIIPVFITSLVTDFFKRNAEVARREKVLNDGLKGIREAKSPELLLQQLAELEVLLGPTQGAFEKILQQLAVKYKDDPSILFSMFEWRPKDKASQVAFIKHLWSYIEDNQIVIDTPEHAAALLHLTTESIADTPSVLREHLGKYAANCMPSGSIKALTDLGLRSGRVSPENFSTLLEWFRSKAGMARLLECLNRLNQDELNWIIPYLHKTLQASIILKASSQQETLTYLRLCKHPDNVAFSLFALVAQNEKNIELVDQFLKTARDYKISVSALTISLTRLYSELMSDEATIASARILLNICALQPRPSTYQALYETLFPRLINIINNAQADPKSIIIASAALLEPFRQMMTIDDSKPFSKHIFKCISTILQTDKHHPALEKIIFEYFSLQSYERTLPLLFAFLPKLNKVEALKFINMLKKKLPGLMSKANQQAAYCARTFFENGRDDFLDMLPELRSTLPEIFADALCTPYVIKCYRDSYYKLSESAHRLAMLYIPIDDRFKFACMNKDSRRIISFAKDYQPVEFWKFLLQHIVSMDALKAVCVLSAPKPTCTVSELHQQNLQLSWVNFLRRHQLKTDSFRQSFRLAVKTCLLQSELTTNTEVPLSQLDSFTLYFLINAGLLTAEQCVLLPPSMLHCLIEARAFEQSFAVQIRDRLTATANTPASSSSIEALMRYTGVRVIRPHPQSASRYRQQPQVHPPITVRTFMPLLVAHAGRRQPFEPPFSRHPAQIRPTILIRKDK